MFETLINISYIYTKQKQFQQKILVNNFTFCQPYPYRLPLACDAYCASPLPLIYIEKLFFPSKGWGSFIGPSHTMDFKM